MASRGTGEKWAPGREGHHHHWVMLGRQRVCRCLSSGGGGVDGVGRLAALVVGAAEAGVRVPRSPPPPRSWPWSRSCRQSRVGGLVSAGGSLGGVSECRWDRRYFHAVSRCLGAKEPCHVTWCSVKERL